MYLLELTLKSYELIMPKPNTLESLTENISEHSVTPGLGESTRSFHYTTAQHLNSDNTFQQLNNGRGK
jgi:hypothetical protein